MNDWQPIENANKKTTEFLVLWWNDEPVIGHWKITYAGSWWNSLSGLNPAGQPTHYITLPEPPK